MPDNAKEQHVPHFTFGINQVFDAAFHSGWLTFPGHYLIYASTGAFQLEVDRIRWLLPPQRAAWVAGNVPFQLSAERPGTTTSVLFAESAIPPPAFECRVFAVSTLAREMLSYAVRWGAERDEQDTTADTFFRALATVCSELAAHPDLFWLPSAQSSELRLALDYTLAHLSDKPTFAEVARAAHVSERTLARRFVTETGMIWSQFAHRARMLRAMELRVAPAMTVIEVVEAVGFLSVSALTHAFRTFTGETPSSYRKRAHST
ncbi:MAG: AraC family transcriptional regulator [Roseiflexaceae bacterium]|nr:AraC family transcriptional regulator [Roseiflexaceae bacterium]